MRSDAVLATIEAAYAPVTDERAWLGGILREVEKFGLGEPCCYCLEPGVEVRSILNFDTHLIDAYQQRISSDIQDMTHTPAPRVESGQARTQRLERHFQLSPGALSTNLGRPLISVLGVLGTNASGNHGVFLGILGCDDAPRRIKRQLAAVAVHMESAFRLRQSLTETTPRDAQAVFSPDGHLLHATEAAVPRQSSLALAVKNVDRARGRLRHLDPDRAAELWSAMVEGRWTLVDHVERDGKRLVLAVENPPEGTIQGLSQAERQVASYAALGHAQKYIAYELGMQHSTVSRHLRSALRKLRLAHRNDLIRLFGPLARLLDRASASS